MHNSLKGMLRMNKEIKSMIIKKSELISGDRKKIRTQVKRS